MYQQQPYQNYSYGSANNPAPLSQMGQRLGYVGTPQQNPSFNLKGRLVTSAEEARASMIDFDGSVFYFPDPASKKIYTKQLNLDGSASLHTYEYVEAPVAAAETNFVSQEEFQKTVNLLLKELELVKGESKHDESE